MMTLLTFFSLVLVYGVNGKLSCIDEYGDPVDMFILYKLPEIIWHRVPHVVEVGKGYVYLDSNNKTFRFGDTSIGNHESPPGRTLDQVYNKHFYFKQDNKVKDKKGLPLEIMDDMAHVFYNDANPEGQEFFKNGHTKGAVGFDDESGFWLISSVPRYPNLMDDGYGYPHTGSRYGQLMMCITFDTKLFDKIGLQLLINNAHVHDGFLPDNWKKQFSNIDRVINGENIDEPPYSNIIDFTSLGGVHYQHFAKSGSYGKDLYASLVALHLESNLLTETWQHGRNIGPTCHDPYKVLDVQSANISFADEYFAFKNFNDHSKFAIGDREENPYVCIGDINRQPSQFRRGGGTMCVKDVAMWKEFRRVIVKTATCGRDEL